MADRTKWVQFIRRGNANRLKRITRSLFQDMSTTLPYLQGVLDISIANSAFPGLAERIAEIRSIARELPTEQFEAALDRIMQIEDERIDLWVVMLGAYTGEFKESHRTFERLVDLAEMQLGLIGKLTKPSSATFAIVSLMRAGALGASQAWTNFLLYQHQRGDVRLLGDLMRVMALGHLTYTVVPYSRWERTQAVAVPEGPGIALSLPVPDAVYEWFRVQIDAIMARSQDRELGIRSLAESVREQIESYQRDYENMWLEMMIEPKWGLRDAGIDCVTISIPELQAAGHRWMRFYPRDLFPSFRVEFCMKRLNGKDRLLEIDLEPSDLLQVRLDSPSGEETLLHWVDRLLAFTAVRAVWMIVMGHLSSDSYGGDGTGPTPGSAIVRPRFRRLPQGFRASPEARARALETFRKEPLQGFTFVRQHERGAFPQSGAPLFALSELQNSE